MVRRERGTGEGPSSGRGVTVLGMAVATTATAQRIQGVPGRPWILTIREDSGKMWAAVTGDEEAFVISGVCVRP